MQLYEDDHLDALDDFDVRFANTCQALCFFDDVAADEDVVHFCVHSP